MSSSPLLVKIVSFYTMNGVTMANAWIAETTSFTAMRSNAIVLLCAMHGAPLIRSIAIGDCILSDENNTFQHFPHFRAQYNNYGMLVCDANTYPVDDDAGVFGIRSRVQERTQALGKTIEGEVCNPTRTAANGITRNLACLVVLLPSTIVPLILVVLDLYRVDLDYADDSIAYGSYEEFILQSVYCNARKDPIGSPNC
ncbi:hypothetical protein BDB00DRAFT_786882 [Zychaea mexicana]|uniref:uncharacterized protein n=1 Tax=Zychaea mexicana TaxID=64656 RepID=UPI0022FE676E|nr:uncharacterized protein BDB00DRAFT_786882 [Zychaea mexicana]KAI9494768.1 hypothetical protein BDB00DRAFT_786882 [Zychaea mexicana]